MTPLLIKIWGQIWAWGLIFLMTGSVIAIFTGISLLPDCWRWMQALRRSRLVFKIRRIGTRSPTHSELGHCSPRADAAEDVTRRIDSASTPQFKGHARHVAELEEARRQVLRFDRTRLDHAAMSPFDLQGRRN